MQAVLRPAPAGSQKKWMVTLGGKTIKFGARGYQDFTQHKDPERRHLYLARHRVRENWKDYMTAGFWSRHLLWEKPTITQAKRSIRKKFGITFVRSRSTHKNLPYY